MGGESARGHPASHPVLRSTGACPAGAFTDGLAEYVLSGQVTFVRNPPQASCFQCLGRNALGSAGHHNSEIGSCGACKFHAFLHLRLLDLLPEVQARAGKGRAELALDPPRSHRLMSTAAKHLKATSRGDILPEVQVHRKKIRRALACGAGA